MPTMDVTAGAGLGSLVVILVVGGARDALERSLGQAPELVELLQALYRDLVVALIGVVIVSVVDVLRPILALFLAVVVVYVALVAAVVAGLHLSALRTWHRWDREALRPVLADLLKQLNGAQRRCWPAPSKAKITWLMGREIFLMQFVTGMPDLTGFSYDRYLRLALSDVGCAFLPMTPTGGVGVVVGVGLAWAQARVAPASGALVLAWDLISLLYLTHAYGRLTRIRARFFVDPERVTSAQLAAFLQQGRDADLTEQQPSAPVPGRSMLSKVAGRSGKAYAADDDASDAEPDATATLEEPSANGQARDSLVMSITRVSGTPRPHYSPSVADGSLRVTTSHADLPDASSAWRQPYLPGAEYSATTHRQSRSGSTTTARPVLEMSMATLGRSSISVATPRARLSATSMTSRVPRTSRLKPEPAPGRLSFRMAIRMMMLGKRALSFAQSSPDQHSSQSSESESGDSFAEANDLVKMFGGPEATQAMSAELPHSLRWWASTGPAALLKTAHTTLALDAILLAVLALADDIDWAVLGLAAASALVKLVVIAHLLKEFTLVTSSGSMARVELLPLSSKKLAEYELGLKSTGLA